MQRTRLLHLKQTLQQLIASASQASERQEGQRRKHVELEEVKNSFKVGYVSDVLLDIFVVLEREDVVLEPEDEGELAKNVGRGEGCERCDEVLDGWLDFEVYFERLEGGTVFEYR